jgi:hypothetical protein
VLTANCDPAANLKSGHSGAVGAKGSEATPWSFDDRVGMQAD